MAHDIGVADTGDVGVRRHPALPALDRDTFGLCGCGEGSTLPDGVGSPDNRGLRRLTVDLRQDEVGVRDDRRTDDRGQLPVVAYQDDLGPGLEEVCQRLAVDHAGLVDDQVLRGERQLPPPTPAGGARAVVGDAVQGGSLKLPEGAAAEVGVAFAGGGSVEGAVDRVGGDAFPAEDRGCSPGRGDDHGSTTKLPAELGEEGGLAGAGEAPERRYALFVGSGEQPSHGVLLVVGEFHRSPVLSGGSLPSTSVYPTRPRK